MCGIAGLWRFHGKAVDEDRLRSMSGKLAHRGPDGEGIWIKGSVGLAHRRLSIVDLSDRGNQPMLAPDGAFAVTFNGEIFNYQDLRDELEDDGAVFRSDSDTEVLLHLYRKKGEGMLEDLRGMFAFAIWDAEKQQLFFARDRIGKKPFFYTQHPDGFAFASEIKALLDGTKAQIDWTAVRQFIGLQYVPSPQTGFIGIHALMPGYCGTVCNGSVTIRPYHETKRTPKLSLSFDEAAQEIRRLTEEAVSLRMIADVPVGAFLSGGMDSSIIVALMAKTAQQPIKTFTMGFPSFGFDERDQAQSFAAHLGTEHHAFEAQPEHLIRLADTLVDLYDAPYADSSALPVYLLAQATRKHVKAVMVGDGGDELFGGYRRYQAFLTAERMRRSGLALGGKLAETIGSLSDNTRMIRFGRMLSAMRHSYGAGYAELFTGSYFDTKDQRALLQSSFIEQTHAAGASDVITRAYQESLGVEGALAFDLQSYLPDDLNVKVDRATMAHGLEARAPFLDQELVRVATSLPLPFLLKRGIQKPLMQAAFKDLLPEELFQRPKRGFQVPLAAWFRKELRPAFIERCLAASSPIAHVCKPAAMKRLLEQNDRGVDHGNRLWMLFSLSTWLSRHHSSQ